MSTQTVFLVNGTRNLLSWSCEKKINKSNSEEDTILKKTHLNVSSHWVSRLNFVNLAFQMKFREFLEIISVASDLMFRLDKKHNPLDVVLISIVSCWLKNMTSSRWVLRNKTTSGYLTEYGIIFSDSLFNIDSYRNNKLYWYSWWTCDW